MSFLIEASLENPNHQFSIQNLGSYQKDFCKIKNSLHFWCCWVLLNYLVACIDIFGKVLLQYFCWYHSNWLLHPSCYWIENHFGMITHYCHAKDLSASQFATKMRSCQSFGSLNLSFVFRLSCSWLKNCHFYQKFLCLDKHLDLEFNL